MTEELNNFPQIPKGWTWTSLEDILLTLESGKRPKGGVRHIKTGIPSIGGEHLLYNGGFDFTKIRYVPSEFYENMSTGKILTKDVLVVKDGATTGKTAFVSDAFPFREAVVNEHVFILRVFKKYTAPEYLFFWMQSPFGQECVKDNFQGTAQGGINSRFIQNSKFPFPPFPEQHRIVARIEEIFARLDAGRESLRKVKTQLRVYRNSLFKAAIEGNLTKEWRKAHGKELETSSKLVDRILKERQTKWEEVELAKMLRKNRTSLGKKNLRRKSYRAPIPSDTPDIDLPNGWIWTNMDTLTYFTVDYRGKTPPPAEKGIPIISAANVRDGKIVVNKPRYVTQETYDKWTTRGFPKSGDLIITTEAPTGEVALYPENKTYLLTRRVLACQTLGVINQYLIYCFKTEVTRRHLHEKSRGTTVPRILKPALMATPIPLPPLLEQQQIIDEVELRISVADEAERIVKECIKQSERLGKSVLKKAFEGKLVPQDPTDEPSEKLLERIREEKKKFKSEEKKKKSNRERGLKQLELVRYVK